MAVIFEDNNTNSELNYKMKMADFNKHNNTAFIIQARLTSSRLPGKILLPFSSDGSTILDIIIEKLKQFNDCSIIVATSENHQNDDLAMYLSSKNVLFYRGSENDVLQRFIETANHFNIQNIIRICSDNPFLDASSIEKLLSVSNASNADYISFNVNGTPSIKTHFGFWTEFVTLGALKKVAQLTNEPLYHEHVTNFIYTHPDLFRIEWIDVPKRIADTTDVRLTIDTIEDFENAQEIYNMVGKDHSIDCLMDFLSSNQQFLKRMHQQIENNKK